MALARVTSRRVEPTTASIVAEMVVEPTAAASASPLESTVATSVSLDDQFAASVTSAVLPSE